MQPFSGHITLDSIIKLLAYVQHYTTPYLSRRGLSAKHLQQLSRWLFMPNDKIQTLRQNRVLAAHFVLLTAAGLLEHDETHWFCAMRVNQWLVKPAQARQQTLLEAVQEPAWEAAVETLKLPQVFDLAYPTFVRQSLQHPFFEPEVASHEPAVWEDVTPSEWRLRLPSSVPPNILFHLLQLGEWCPSQPLPINSLSIAYASEQGYALHFIQHILEKATQTSLPLAKQQQLLAWYRAAEAYKIQHTWLLSTAQPDQLAEIMGRQRLNRRIQQQISPRHALVAPEIITPLKKWLAKRGRSLSAPSLPDGAEATELSASAYTWLGLKLLIELKRLLALPLPAPYSLLDKAARALSPDEQTALAFSATQLVEGLQEAFRGRDAFVPAAEAPPEAVIELIREAIETEAAMQITYQALGAYQATVRQIQPLRLEQRGALFYLHGYCYLAERNLIFRLDRLATLHLYQSSEALLD